MGLEGNQIDSLLKYLSVAAGHAEPYVKGPSGWQELNSILSMAPAMKGFGGPAGSPQATSYNPAQATYGAY
jgi:hypothetical protein